VGKKRSEWLDMPIGLCYIPLLFGGGHPAPPKFSMGRLAQLVEQLTLNQRVVGSSPTAPTIEKVRKTKGFGGAVGKKSP
jgi:hypothetical protein